MRITAIIFCISILFAACADAPKESTDTTGDKADLVTEEEQEPEEWSENPMDFTPDGYVLYQTYKGDLNRDEFEDMVAVFNAVDSNDEMINRAVMLLTADKDGKLTMAALNKEGAYCPDCGGAMGDPLASVVIKNGYFTIEHFGGSRERWTDDPTFKYSTKDGKWYLHRRSKIVYDALDPENGSTETMLSTRDFGVVNFEDFRY